MGRLCRDEFLDRSQREPCGSDDDPITRPAFILSGSVPLARLSGGGRLRTQPIARRIEIHIRPAEVDRLRHPQTVAEDHGQQSNIALTLPTNPAGGVDYPAGLV